MNEIIDGLYRSLKSATPYIFKGERYDLTDRDARNRLVGLLIDEHLPDDSHLSRLTDFILYEELTDSHPDKVSREEYPFMSEYQLARRRAGVHRRRSRAGEAPTHSEVGLDATETIATDGVDYRYPTRRKISLNEALWIDENMRSRNKERRRNYNDFVRGKSEGVFTVSIGTGEKTVHDSEKYEKFYGNTCNFRR